jgi:predicted nucleic acid-binding protein
MIYIDTSVALAQLLAEDRYPPAALWSETLVASRLLDYEVWTRMHARGLARSHAEAVHSVFGRIAFLELIPEVVKRAREPFPGDLRTLDALHLASAIFLIEQGQPTALASYDQRMLRAAKKLKLEIYSLD